MSAGPRRDVAFSVADVFFAFAFPAFFALLLVLPPPRAAVVRGLDAESATAAIEVACATTLVPTACAEGLRAGVMHR